jgi:TolB protein
VSGEGGIPLATARVIPNESYVLPTWSPDGRWIAFAVMTTDADGNSRRVAVDVVAADGSSRRTVTRRPGLDTQAIAWSPDGRYLAYLGLPDGTPVPAAADGAPWELFVATLDGTGDRQVTHGGSFPEQVQWSPDGHHLAFLALVDGATWHLATIPMSGPDPVGPVVVGPEHDGRFAWSPDGTLLAFVRTIERSTHSSMGRTAILTVDPEFASPPTSLVELGRTITCVSWQWLEP